MRTSQMPNWMGKKAKLVAAVGGMLVALGISSKASADLLLTFDADASEIGFPELIWDNSPTAASPLKLLPGSGSSQNGNEATSGGLRITTQVDVPGAIVGKSAGPNGGTVFKDVTLILDNMNVNGPALSFGLGSIIEQDLQQNVGHFKFVSEGGLTTLLEGNINNPSIFVINHTTAFISADDVQYTGGALYNVLSGLPNFDPSGTLSWSLNNFHTPLGIVPGTSITNPPNGGRLEPFSADATGLFTIPNVPEPFSVGVFGLGAIGLLSGRRGTRRRSH